jgi:hypothetical protein
MEYDDRCPLTCRRCYRLDMGEDKCGGLSEPQQVADCIENLLEKVGDLENEIHALDKIVDRLKAQ